MLAFRCLLGYLTLYYFVKRQNSLFTSVRVPCWRHRYNIKYLSNKNLTSLTFISKRKIDQLCFTKALRVLHQSICVSSKETKNSSDRIITENYCCLVSSPSFFTSTFIITKLDWVNHNHPWLFCWLYSIV